MDPCPQTVRCRRSAKLLWVHLPNTRLEQEVGLGSETKTSPEEVGAGCTLAVQRVDHIGTRLDHWSLERVGKQRKHRVHRVPLLVLSPGLVSDPGHQLGEDGKVEEEGRSEQRVLAQVGDVQTVTAAHAELGGVVVHGNLLVADRRLVLDDDAVVRVLALVRLAIGRLLTGDSGLVEKVVGSTAVVDHRRLGDLLGLELALRAQVVAVIVTQMVVRGNRKRLDTCIDEELGEHRLDLGLTSFEVVTADESLVLLGKLDAAGNEGVLRSTVDVRGVLEDAGDGEDGRGRDLGVVPLNSLEEVVGRVVDAGEDLRVSLGVGSPDDNDLVEVVLALELADVGTDLVDVSSLGLAREGVVSTLLLVLSDKVGVVDRGEGLHFGHVRGHLALEVVVKHLGAGHGLVHGHARDVPAAEDKVVGVDHGEDVGEGDPDILAGGRVCAQTNGGGADERAVVVGHLKAVLVVPSDVVLVGEDGGRDGGTVVTTPANHHETGAGHLALGLELVLALNGGSDVLGGAISVVNLLDMGVEVLVVRGDGLGGVLDLVRVDADELALFVTSVGGVEWHVGAVAVGSVAVGGVVSVSDRGHIGKGRRGGVQQEDVVGGSSFNGLLRRQERSACCPCACCATSKAGWRKWWATVKVCKSCG